jgi:glycosyltransferase involved in cell wall biosynthesis
MSARRIAWLFPSLGKSATGFPWHPLFQEFTRLFPNTVIFTGKWPGFAPGYEDRFTVRTIGKTFKFGANPMQYKRGLMYLSPKVIAPLLQFKPDVIIANAFSLWTVFVIAFKPLMRWRVIILYEGSSPTADSKDAKVRSFLRRSLAQMADAFITNTTAGKAYLTATLQVQPQRVFVQPYEVPTAHLLLRTDPGLPDSIHTAQRPLFFYVGQIIERKGIRFLLEACRLLKQQDASFTLLIGGEGPQRAELEALTQHYQLQDCVQWLGWVNYESLGYYFQAADVFVFPTLEDTWGMVALEAMAFAKPVLCSLLAGSAELVADGENGYLFDPQDADQLAQQMQTLIDQPELIQAMGTCSKTRIAAHTVEAVARALAEIVEGV